MSRFALCLLLALASPILAPPAAAQKSQDYGTQAYAPENLGQLPVNDRIRVIEREYAEQSGGRRLPDDQLEFYLDQIQHSRWTFSQIRQDIATSLRGSGGNRPGDGWRPPGGGWQPESLICTSDRSRYQECRTPFRGRAELVEQLSSTACVEGRTWGWREGMIWVDRGCRGRFAEIRGQRPGQDRAVVCESVKGRYQECRTGFRGPAELLENLSSTRCVAGVNWGEQPGMVWVDQGCRASFVESRYSNRPPGRPGGGFNVTCSSVDGRFVTCAWDARQGRPLLIEQLSSSACLEGQSWGYDGQAIWVNRGCRARFGTR